MSDLCKQLAVYAVTDRSWLNGRRLVDDIRKVLDGGVTILQLREKELPFEEFLAEAREIKALCDSYGVPLIINDEVGIAKELGVGAHVGQHDESLAEARAELGPDAIIGVSCENVAQAIAAEKGGADYLGVGAVFPTSTKTDAAFVDSRELAAICAAVKIPVVAIGGISLDNLMTLGGSGIVGVAVVSALFAAADPFAAIDSVVDRANAELGLDPSAGQDMTANAFGTAPDPTAANNGALGGADSFATGDAATAGGGETAGSEPTRRERMLESLQQARRQRQTRYDSLANANRQEAQEPQAAQETAEPAQEPEYSVPTPRTNQTNRTNRTQPEEQDSGGGAATGGRASDGNADSDGPAARRARLLETLRAAREQRQSRYSSETEAGESEP